MIKLIEKLLNWIYIERCFFCGKESENTRLCPNCRREIKLLSLTPSVAIEGCNVYCATIYEGKIKQLIHRVKFKHDKKLAIEQAKIMEEYWEKLGLTQKFVVIPVPQHKKREKQRHGNHMHTISTIFSEYFGYKYINDFVIRTKNTKPQYKLTKEARKVFSQVNV